MSWLYGSIEPRIGNTYLYYKTAKDIWGGVQKMYSDIENTTQSFEMRSAIHSTKQRSMTVTDYFNSLTNLWQEMDLYYETDWNCTDDNTKYNLRLEKERVCDFLKGLNLDLDKVQGRILATKPLPSTCDTFVEVRREESHKRVMLSNFGMNSASQASALATQSA
ncbi:hypothetical protein Patl1_10965 [Pistacia atlantica]|uniref:Uncharacterized protein n=1 Tax=Pistacia atlantica TaxID=434234 RepID=A0ACC1A7L3_9ROSI|nr:hypothetical protein Patl1_10965 [Pistacia atlantica]